MRYKHFFCVCATVLVLAFASSLSARGQVWGFLGGTQVHGHGDHDTIEVTRHDIPVRAIQVRISGQTIFVDRLVVHLDKDASQEFAVGDRISPEGKSYVIDLPHEFKAVESVELWYYREPGKPNLKVSLYGTSDKSQLDAVSSGQYLSRLR
jgi:hypothetical protein